jgi:hypothetical protein
MASKRTTIGPCPSARMAGAYIRSDIWAERRTESTSRRCGLGQPTGSKKINRYPQRALPLLSPERSEGSALVGLDRERERIPRRFAPRNDKKETLLLGLIPTSE